MVHAEESDCRHLTERVNEASQQLSRGCARPANAAHANLCANTRQLLTQLEIRRNDACSKELIEGLTRPPSTPTRRMRPSSGSASEVESSGEKEQHDDRGEADRAREDARRKAGLAATAQEIQRQRSEFTARMEHLFKESSSRAELAPRELCRPDRAYLRRLVADSDAFCRNAGDSVRTFEETKPRPASACNRGAFSWAMAQWRVQTRTLHTSPSSGISISVRWERVPIDEASDCPGFRLGRVRILATNDSATRKDVTFWWSASYRGTGPALSESHKFLVNGQKVTCPARPGETAECDGRDGGPEIRDGDVTFSIMGVSVNP